MHSFNSQTIDNFENSIVEIIPDQVRSKLDLMAINEAICHIHFPDSVTTLQAARRRFKFEELFYMQLILGVNRQGIKATTKQLIYNSPGTLLKKIFEKLPFELTAAQKRVVHEIWADMKSKKVMNRLLQGDVGSGKTVVAKDRLYVMPETGRRVFFDAHYSPIFNKSGDVVGGLSIVNNVTERKQAEEALRKSEEKYRNVVENINVGVVVIQDGTFAFANSTVSDVLGYTMEEVLSNPNFMPTCSKPYSFSIFSE